METFRKLFASLLVLVYHCFDRVVIQGYLPLLTRPEHIVYFFRDVHGIYPITKQALRQRTQDYQHWVEAFARNHRIPLQWPDPDRKKKGLRQEDFARPYLVAMERRQRFGVYFIFKTMEPGPNFRSCQPKYPTQDPRYRIIKRQWSRYTHFYFYIRDEVLGPHDPVRRFSSPFPLATGSTVIPLSPWNSTGKASVSTSMTTPFFPSRIRKPCRPQPIASAPTSSAHVWIIGRWS